MSDILTGLYTSLITIGVYIVWKLIKRFGINSKCSNGQFILSFQDLTQKIDETHKTIELFTHEFLRSYQKYQIENQQFSADVVIPVAEEKKE